LHEQYRKKDCWVFVVLINLFFLNVRLIGQKRFSLGGLGGCVNECEAGASQVRLSKQTLNKHKQVVNLTFKPSVVTSFSRLLDSHIQYFPKFLQESPLGAIFICFLATSLTTPQSGSIFGNQLLTFEKYTRLLKA